MSVVDEVAVRLRAAILAGDHEAGSPLRQDLLARELGVSKIPLREALQQLNGQGLVTARSNCGISVRTLVASEAEEIFALRQSLEPMLLRQAIEHQTIVDLAQAELAITTGDLPTAVQNWRFHRALYRPAGWDRGLSIVESLHHTVAPYVTHYMHDLDGAALAESEHLELLDYCRNSRVDQAVAILTVHLDHARTALIQHLRPAKAEMQNEL